MAAKSVLFLERWGAKSYLVQYDGPFSNDRPAHVQTPTTDLTGKTFQLGSRSVRRMKGNVAVMYEVVGVTDGKYPAHITVYFGPADRADEY